MNYRIEIIQETEKLIALKEFWDEILNECDENVFFLKHEWMETLWKLYRLKKILFIILIYDDKKLICIAPLCIRKLHNLRILEFIGETKSDYQDFIIRRNYNQKVLKIICEVLFLHKNKWDIISLKKIPEYSKNTIILNELLLNYSFNYSIISHEVSPLIHINNSWEEYLKTRKKKFVNDTNRQIKRLTELGELIFEIVEDSASIDTTIKAFIEQKGKRIYNSKIAGSPYVGKTGYDFFWGLSNSEIKENLHFSLLRINNNILATHIGFKYKNRFYYYMPSINQEFQRFSVGRVLLFYLIRDAFAKEMNCFDFLNGNEGYKYDWTTEQISLNEILIFKNRIIKYYYSVLDFISYNRFILSLKKNDIVIQIYKSFLKFNNRFFSNDSIPS